MQSKDHSFAVVILAARATPSDRERVAGMVQVAREAGAQAIVAAVPRGWRAPPYSRVVHVAPGASAISAIRSGMAQLSNTSVRHAMLWPLEAADAGVARLAALVRGAQSEEAALALLEGDDVEHAPLMIARDAWLDLMTLGEQGMSALGDRRGLHRVAIDAT